jgi:hypothetical protein
MNMAGLLGKIKERLIKTGSRMEECQDAITFAEAGASHLEAIPVETTCNQQQVSKLLVMGQESTFSKEIVDYAIEMAQRMSYDILALSTAPLSCDTFKMFSSSHRKVCEDFRNLSEENTRPFKQAASAQGIPFEHVVMFSEPEAALEAITRKNENISFVISETVEDREVNRQESSEQLRPSLYVYSVV